MSDLLPHARFGVLVRVVLCCRMSCLRVSRCHLSKDSLANGVMYGEVLLRSNLKVVSDILPCTRVFTSFEVTICICGARGGMF